MVHEEVMAARTFLISSMVVGFSPRAGVSR